MLKIKFNSFILRLLINRCRQYVKQVSEGRSLAEGTSASVCVLFMPAAVAEGGLLVKGYLWRLFYGVNTRRVTRYSLYKNSKIEVLVAPENGCELVPIRDYDGCHKKKSCMINAWWISGS